MRADALKDEDPVQLQEFEDRIARGEKIEPMDWMPSLYKRQLILSQLPRFQDSSSKENS